MPIINIHVFGVALDPDAEAFITAAGITDATQKTAINDLVVGLKDDSLWSKFYVAYPWVGGTAASHKWNLVNPVDANGAYRATFAGTITHNANGITPGGASTDYVDTHLNGSTILSNANSHWSFYSRTNVDDLFSDYGQSASADNTEVLTRYLGSCYNDVPSGVERSTSVQANSLGFYTGSCNAGSVITYKNGAVISSYTNPATSAYGNSNMVFCSGASALGRPSTRNLAWGSIGTALTDTDVSNLNILVQAFQTALSRNV